MQNHTIDSIRAGLLKKEFSAEEVTKQALAYAESENPKTNAYITLSNERALAAAKAVDAKIAAGEELGALAGVPVAVKDVILTKGLRTTCASKLLANYIPPYDATAVIRLEQAGGIIIGKANCDEFAMGSSNMTSHFGGVENPWKRSGDNRKLVPGGELFFQSDVWDLALEAMAVFEEFPHLFANCAGAWSFTRENPFGARSEREVRCSAREMRIWRILYRKV